MLRLGKTTFLLSFKVDHVVRLTLLSSERSDFVVWIFQNARKIVIVFRICRFGILFLRTAIPAVCVQTNILPFYCVAT